MRFDTNVVTPVVKPPSALTIPVALISPVVSISYNGIELFIPSLLFVSSQNNWLSPVIPVPFPYAI